MHPVDFKYRNFTFKGTLLDLPCFKGPEQIISCWKIGFWEHIKLIFTGKIWLYVWGGTHPHVGLSAEYPFEESKSE